MFLFILESIGTPELILIAVVALIVLGPRKLPQMAKTIAKTMAEFRSASNEFKSTWEKEVAFEDDLKKENVIYPPQAVTPENDNFAPAPGSPDAFEHTPSQPAIAAPEIKRLSAEDIAQNFQIKETPSDNSLEPTDELTAEKKIVTTSSNKHDWL